MKLWMMPKAMQVCGLHRQPRQILATDFYNQGLLEAAVNLGYRPYSQAKAAIAQAGVTIAYSVCQWEQ